MVRAHILGEAPSLIPTWNLGLAAICRIAASAEFDDTKSNTLFDFAAEQRRGQIGPTSPIRSQRSGTSDRSTRSEPTIKREATQWP